MRIRWSSRADGDFHRTEAPFAALEATRRAFVDLPWTMLDEQHGVVVRRVGRPGEHDGVVGDVALTACAGAVLGCWVGDCAPVVLIGARDEVATVHAGWRGLAAGVVDRAVDAFSEPVAAAYVGPCIGSCCYEFGEADLDRVAAGVHAHPDAVRASTRAGTVSLDMVGAVAAACAARGLAITTFGACTGCTYDGFSHRVRGDRERHVVAVWQEAAA